MFCLSDRDLLLRAFCQRNGIPVGETLPWDNLPVPARMLDDVLTDLGYRIVLMPLHDHILGRCDFERRRILVNTRIPEITLKNTKVEGVVNFTKAHELGHVRFPDHERQVREEAGDSCTPSLFGEPPGERAVIVCNREGQGPRPLREYEADYYASQFLVPSEQLLRCDAARRLETAWREQQTMPQGRLWAEVLSLADYFQVTGALMVRRLVEHGWIVRHQDRAIELSPEVELFA